MSEVNPLQLLQRCEAGEAAAIDEFVRTYQPAAYRLALSILDDPAEADEAAQDALVTALGRLASFRGEAAFTTWLYAITLNLCRARLRRRRSRLRLARILQEVFRLGDQGQHPEVEIQKFEADSALWSAIRSLAEAQREAIVLRYYHDLPIAQIARVAGVSERTVHNRLRAAHDRLRTLMKERETS
jgi:RNA polymerase sigma-70 factor (ECF subfamily)